MKKQRVLPALFTASVLAIGMFGAPAVSAATLFQQVTNVATNDSLNLRSRPGTDGAVIGTIPHNGRTIVATGKQQGNWVEVSWAGQVGWVHERYLEDSPAAGRARTTARTTLTTARAATRAPARRAAARAPSVSHTHPANACTRSIRHSHPNGGIPHEHHYACQPNTMSMVKPKFKPKAPQVVMPAVKPTSSSNYYMDYTNNNAEINYGNP